MTTAEANSMKIDVTYDLVCPWCHLGLQRFARAVATSGRDDVTITLWPFQLAPEVPEEGVDHFEFFANRVGRERVGEIYASMEALAKREGMQLDYDRVRKLPNTALAHQLVLQAQTRGKGLDVAIAAMRAHFVDGRDIGARETLEWLATSHGLDAELHRSETGKALEDARQRSRGLGITGVPHFVIDGQPHPGAISAEQWRVLLSRSS